MSFNGPISVPGSLLTNPRLWYNGVPALNFTNLEIRTSDQLASIGGLYFSTFFGGDDSSWATPTDQFSYYKNIQIFAGSGAATGEGAPSGSSRTVSMSSAAWGMAGVGLLTLLVQAATRL